MNQKLVPQSSSAQSVTTPGTPTRDALLHIMLAWYQVRPMQHLHNLQDLQGVDVDVVAVATMLNSYDRSRFVTIKPFIRASLL